MTGALLKDSRIDGLLRFPPALERTFEERTGAVRVATLRRSILIGLALYNAYNFTSFYLLPDVLWFSIAVRILVVTPLSFGIIWLVGRLSAPLREGLVFGGIFNAFAAPVLFFWLSADPHSAFTVGELTLVLVFANMLLALRFRHALTFTAASFALFLLAIATKSGLDPALRPAFILQFATAGIFTLYANWFAEHARCSAFLAEYDARCDAEKAERASRAFRDLSLTDSLTGLPNRRALDVETERLAAVGPFALMMIDVDHFKLFNDRLGHPAGDACLRALGACLAAAAQAAGGRAARFGGEEFCVALGGASELEAARLAGALVEAVRALALPHPARADGLAIVTVSIGLARSTPAARRAPAEVLAAADAALYAAKRRGRDGWMAAPEVAFARVG